MHCNLNGSVVYFPSSSQKRLVPEAIFLISSTEAKEPKWRSKTLRVKFCILGYYSQEFTRNAKYILRANYLTRVSLRQIQPITHK